MNLKVLAAVLVPVLLMIGLFGCGWESGESYTTSQGQVTDLSGTYDVTVTPYGLFETMILRHTGNKLEGTDNLGRTWSGTVSGLSATGTDQSWQGQMYMETGGSNPGKIRAEVMVGEVVGTYVSPFSNIGYGEGFLLIVIEGEYTKADGKVGPVGMVAVSMSQRATPTGGE